jgi:tetratricopeptide (TPR) repeat protein
LPSRSAVYRVESDLGDVQLEEGRLDAAERHFQKALAGAEALNINRRGRGYILGNLGNVCLRQGRIDEARRYLSRISVSARTIRSPNASPGHLASLPCEPDRLT